MITPNEIKNILENSGYLFEQKVASIIENLNFYVQTNRAYQDADKRISREIDIVAHKQIFALEAFETKGICYLFCECKNSNTPFVFLTRKKGLLDKYYCPKEFQFVNEGFYFAKETFLGIFTQLGLEKNHYYTKVNRKAVQFCKITRNGNKFEAQHSGVVEGILYPLIKAFLDLYPNTPNSTETKKYCKLTFNIVVVNSQLYEIDTEDDSAIPQEVNFVPFLHEIKSDNIDGSFLITFVNFKYFEQFLKKEVLEFCELIGERYRLNSQLLLSVPVEKL